MKNMPTKAPNYLNRLAALLVFLSMLLVSSANAQEDLFSNAPYVSHWETVDGVARYGYWHEVYPGYEREVGHWDYSAGNGHWETRYTGENTYDEEDMMQFMGRIGLSSDQTRLALSKIQDAANANVARLALAQGKCPNFMDQPLVVDGVTLTIRGTVKVNGVVELGTVFYNP